MNSYIQKLLFLFYEYSEELLNNKVVSEINKKQISVDYLSKNKKWVNDFNKIIKSLT